MIVFGTGFETHGFVAPMEVRGLEARPERGLGPTARGVPGHDGLGFPNMFVLYGPNTNHGARLGPLPLECQFDYVLDALGRMRDRGFR